MGIPVVIADNGRGFPVRPVESGYPVMTVAENGRGAPIVISENGSPFIIEGYELIQGFALSSDDGSNIADDQDQPVETY